MAAELELERVVLRLQAPAGADPRRYGEQVARALGSALADQLTGLDINEHLARLDLALDLDRGLSADVLGARIAARMLEALR